MSDAAETTTPGTRNPLTKWVDEMQDVIKQVTSLIDESDRHRAAAESTQREFSQVRDAVASLRAEIERQRELLEATSRERDELREANVMLQSENERLRNEQTEAGETASKLLGEMKELVNQVAHKFQGPSRTSPFAREPRPPNP